MREDLVRVISCEDAADPSFLNKEWLVTNGLGGYASCTLAGILTRRYHGYLIASLPNPCGRMVVLNQVIERIFFDDGASVQLNAEESSSGPLQMNGSRYLSQFRLEAGLPVWRYEINGTILEKRVLMPYRHNTVHLVYGLSGGDGKVRLELRPCLNFRRHDEPVSRSPRKPYVLSMAEDTVEISAGADMPRLKLMAADSKSSFMADSRRYGGVIYRREESRGYESRGELWSPGSFFLDLRRGGSAALIASTEEWTVIRALDPQYVSWAERERRFRLISLAGPEAGKGFGAELVLAADQFIVEPAERIEDTAFARAAGDEACTAIAGYHWFTDWGRDTMIGLEGLTLATGRHREAGWIIRTFARYVRDGLIPNMFPEGESGGLYNTADATLWYFHAISRYLEFTNDRMTLKALLPRLAEIIGRHMAGTRFGIRMDASDSLIRQGEIGLPLTWMDARVGDWVVTPRRGKTVEINSLWYNALKLMEQWTEEEEGADAARLYRDTAERVYQSFNERFWFEEGAYLYDLIDGEKGNDSACRPNQIFSLSLGHPVLDPSRWPRILDVVSRR
ncbi:MAG: amylo-alpha-1,6-glucosidase, partial [Syntrophales bacterium]|nr:amylo-alpha-1,6-glucosidase [Syntrophales bacterium]